jgi:beta-lactamase superfamily II metal-dependent hydrolase
MFPAREGDCLLVTYEGNGRLHRVLVDGGRKATARTVRTALRKLPLPAQERAFEALIVTHVDRDHIEGVLSLLDDACQ